ncbi:MAG: type II toxin-antitoxin system PemK/MazF family toxin [Desulfovermiculus sp.]|nr:type II toxin-antitoxin system PemK/MazF family toxin [Desulfovermiculus sp.]
MLQKIMNLPHAIRVSSRAKHIRFRILAIFKVNLVSCESSEETGLKKESQIMVDKIVALSREKVAHIIGQVDDDTVVRLHRSIAFWLGLAYIEAETVRI